MRRFHMDPRESLQAFFDLGAKRMVPMHYDTFVNSYDEVGAALKELEAAKRSWDLEKREVVPLAVGERRVFLKVGEGPSFEPAKAKDPNGWGTSATPATSKRQPAKPQPKNDVPDADKLD